jgi:tetraacyldisaccharide 4'-kinase
MNPLSAIFGAGAAIRNALYDRQVLEARRLTRPVISIGNISVGGTGKTPFVIALGTLLHERGISFDVLSRGYGRSSTEPASIDPNGAPEQFGDEPLLIAQKLNVPVIVNADRYQAGLMAEAMCSSQLHLLDDGFQHRRLHRDFDIVLLQPNDLQDALLPVGRLREPLSSLRRAHALVLPDSMEWSFDNKRIWHVNRHMALDAKAKAGKAVAFCGIARPEQFFAGLGTNGDGQVIKTVVFPDHHRYSQPDVARLVSIKAATGAQIFITTEKDRINLGPLASQLEPISIVTLRMELQDARSVVDDLINNLEQSSGCRLWPGHEKI